MTVGYARVVDRHVVVGAAADGRQRNPNLELAANCYRGRMVGRDRVDIIEGLRLAEPGVKFIDLMPTPIYAPLSMPRLAARRTALTEQTINTINKSASPCLLVPFIKGRDGIGKHLQERRRRLIDVPIPILIAKRRELRGAVSPATRAKASITPVITPEVAVRR